MRGGTDRPADVVDHAGVRLTRWRTSDAASLHQVVAESRDHLRPWLRWADEFSISIAVELTRRWEEGWRSGAEYHYAISRYGTPVGSCGLVSRIGPGGLEIIYWLHPRYIGHGLATMAVAALVEQAFNLPPINRLEIVHDIANRASGAIPHRLGFVLIDSRRPPPEMRAAGEAGIDLVWRLTRLAVDGRCLP